MGRDIRKCKIIKFNYLENSVEIPMCMFYYINITQKHCNNSLNLHLFHLINRNYTNDLII